MITKKVYLKPIKESTEDYEAIESAIVRLFKKEIYLPLLAQVGGRKHTLQNKKPNEDLIEAILSGQIAYFKGYFVGKFNSDISADIKRMGGRWDRNQSSWKIAQSKILPEIHEALQVAHSRLRQTIARIDRLLEKILPEEISEKLDVEQKFDSTMRKVDAEFQRSVRSISVTPKLTAHDRKKIAEEYTNNMRISIKGWMEKEIVKLRKEVQKNAFSGNRYENLAKTIQESYGVSQSKAKFLARQETSLMMTKFKETRYVSAGVKEYEWGCVSGSAAHPVRPMHKNLQGKTFRWDNPPVVNEKGERKNPGQDFGCRCFAKPVIHFREG